MWPALVECLRKFETHGLGVRVRLELGGILSNSDPVKFLPHTELLQDRHVERQQRFADVETRVPVLVHNRHVAALLRQHCADGRAGGAAANDEHLAAALSIGNVDNFQPWHGLRFPCCSDRRDIATDRETLCRPTSVHHHVIAPSTLII